MGGSNTGMTGGNDLAGQFLNNRATQPSVQLPTITQPQRQPLPQIPTPPMQPPPAAPQAPAIPAGYVDVGGQKIKPLRHWGTDESAGHLNPGNFNAEAIAASREAGKHGFYPKGTLQSVHNAQNLLFPGRPGFPGLSQAAPSAPMQPPAMSEFQKMAQALNQRGKATR